MTDSSETIDLSNAYERLPPRRRRFIDELCKHGKKAQAARDAGYSPKQPSTAAVKLLADPLVRAAYEQRMDELTQEAGVEAKRVLQELAHIGFARMNNYCSVQSDGSAIVDLSNLTDEQWAAIQEISVDEYTEGRGDEARNVKRVAIKLAQKKGPLELLGKHLKMWTDKHEVAGPGGVPLQPPSIAITFDDGGPGSAGPAAADDGVETS